MVNLIGLTKFKELYKQSYGINLNQKELIEKANKLLNLYKLVYSDTSNIKIKNKNEKKIKIRKNHN